MVNGNVVWSDVLSSYTGADADTKGVYSTDATGRIWKYGPLNGQKAWDNSDLENRQPTAPTIVAGGSRIVVGDRQGNLHWLDTTNGQIVSRTTGDPAGYQVPVAVSGNTLFAFGRSGVLTALSNQ
jgi:outer membrane protein assembly factor BamB